MRTPPPGSRRNALFLLLCVLGVATELHAQATIPNLLIEPTRVEFVASPDHAATWPLSGEAIVTKYEGRYYTLDASGNIPSGASPAFVVDFGKPSPAAGNLISLSNVFGGLVSNTAYRLRVAAVGPGGATAADADRPFGREARTAPRAVIAPAVK